ncbi:MAG: RES family NAD+ phosphorylase [Bacteroidia bacterium]|nr:RES family NAD+ phosphorylase [Bacteroidia bacterium]MCF8425383.1 RES family NAD+ phosphorylase [Bacteroidia bacterium]MCF8447561.1 RES family NAD+ phosphorylase [Bacteroidia bacterium]
MQVFRLSRNPYASDLSGMGAKQYGGRWNSVGTSMLYTASHASLAALEVACNSGGVLGLRGFKLACIEIEDKAEIIVWEKEDLSSTWNTYPAPYELAKMGDNWVTNFESLALKVPSAVVPYEYNILLNPLHPKFQKLVRILWVKPFTFDPRLFS